MMGSGRGHQPGPTKAGHRTEGGSPVQRSPLSPLRAGKEEVKSFSGRLRRTSAQLIISHPRVSLDDRHGTSLPSVSAPLPSLGKGH